MSAQKISILIIEDEKPWAQFLEEFLTGLGYRCRVALTGEEGIEAFKQEPSDVVLMDLRLPDVDGMEATRTIKHVAPDTIVVVMTGYATSEAAIQAFESGASEFITKPFNANQIHLVVTRVLEHRRLAEENDRLRRLIESRSCFDQIVGAAPAMQSIYKLIEQVAPSDTAVVIAGEAGTGKGLIAEAIHHTSGRPESRFEAVQCSELANGDADSALFGVEGQGEGFAAMGALERAAEGTAFLRGVEALPPPVQDRLATTLQDHQIVRSGGRRPVPLRARLVASTCAPLLELVESGQFRRDLYYRLGVVTIASPPLRERREDIPLLANFFLEKFNRKHNRRVEKFSFEALLVLSTYGWPGNVAELESEVERLVAQDTTGTIKLNDLPAHLQREMTAGTNGVGAANVPLREAKKRFEREYFRDLLRRTKGNMSLASRSSRVGRPYLYKKINDYQIDPNDFR